MLNGKLMGWCNGPELRMHLIALRRNHDINRDTSFYIDDQYLYVDASPSRLLRPLLIVNYETQRLVIDEKSISDLDPYNLIEMGAMEKISAWEEQNLVVAPDYDTLQNGLNVGKKYTHCEISGRAALGIAADAIPYMQHNQAPRNMYQCLWKEELVIMSNGEKKKIKDIKIGDSMIGRAHI